MPKLAEITGLRGAAALSVVGFHALFFAAFTVSWPKGPLADVLGVGWMGVDFFLVLSAFLLALPLVAGPAQKTSAQSWGGFVFRRWLRIAPPYLASIFVTLVLTKNLGYFQSGWRDLVLHAFYVHNAQPGSFLSVNSVYWSLAIEFQFYLIVPLLVWLVRRRESLAYVVLAILTSVLWRAAVHVPGDPGTSFWLDNQLPGFLGHFVLGVFAARVYRSGQLSGDQARRATAAVATALIAGTLLLLNRGAARYPTIEPSLVTASILRPLLSVGFCSLILFIVHSPVAKRLLGGNAMVRLGDMSYSIYLLHVPIGFFVLPYLSPLLHVGFVPFLLALVAVTVLGCAVFYFVVERPSLALKTIVQEGRLRLPSRLLASPMAESSAQPVK